MSSAELFILAPWQTLALLAAAIITTGYVIYLIITGRLEV
tara:strand:- start:615 stop:734 length:120 start_codon:yes stop_codon:yes gene_type:complete